MIRWSDLLGKFTHSWFRSLSGLQRSVRQIITFALIFFCCTLLSPPPAVHAASVPPFPPFSVEGNPPEDYYFGAIFNLFRYFRPSALQIFENRDRSRVYEDLMVCPGAEADRRDYYCDNQGNADSGCDGGEIDICHADTGGAFAYTANSGNGRCNLPKPNPDDPTAVLVGTCEYDQIPSITRKIKGTDFSIIEDLTFPKIQSESNAYNFIGNDNSITWGSLYLGSDACEINIRKLLVVRRAKQTKSTVAQTGEWPLGWVDWGYKDTNMTKTLLEIDNEIPNDIAGRMLLIIEGTDDFYLNGGNLSAVTDISKAKNYVCEAVKKAGSGNSKPRWLTDLETVPMYSPSFRQGYVRPSICVWDICCPGNRCKVEPSGVKRSLYYDLSISQTYGAALNNLFSTHSLKEGIQIYVQLVAKNPVAMFLTSAGPEATPSRIKEKLEKVGASPCLEYIPWSDWLDFGTHIDYLSSKSFLGPNNTCPDYQIMPEVKKETAAARSLNILQVIINFIWGGTIDDVEPKKFHLITIPDLMGQSIGDLQQPVYDTGDTASELESIKEYNEDMSNIVDDEAEFLYSGKRSGVNNSKRLLPLYSCGDNMFSSQTETSIEAYAFGTRNGCFEDSATASASGSINCDQTVPEQNLPGLSVEDGKRYTDALFAGCTGNSQWMQCHNDVIKRARESGVDPLFALAIWIHESGASNYICGEQYHGGIKIQDFGYNVPELAENFVAQIVGFLALPTAYEYCGKDMNNFIAKFWFGHCYDEITPEEVANVAIYIDALKGIYAIIAPGQELIAWPQIGPYVPSNPNPTNPTTKPGSSSSPSPTNRPWNSSLGFFPETCGDGYLKTALGCIPYNRDAFTSALLAFVVGIAGAIALVIMLIATVQIMTAGGNAEQLQKGKELFTSAIIGLLFLIFSVSLLRIIAGDIINLPGF